MSDAFINISYSYFYVRVYVVFSVAPVPPPTDSIAVFSDSFLFSLFYQQGNLLELISKEFLLPFWWLRSRWSWRVAAGAGNSCCEYHSTLFIFCNQCSRMIHFLLFYQEAGCGRRRTQFMFVTVKEVFLPMHTPRSTFPLAIISALNIWQLYTWVTKP